MLACFVLISEVSIGLYMIPDTGQAKCTEYTDPYSALGN